MKFPWTKDNLETRQSGGYTDTLLQQLLARAEGKPLPLPLATAALEGCCGVIGRAFAAAEVIGPPMLASALNPYILEMLARALIRRGECLFLIDTTGGKLQLLPADSWDVDGGPRPDEWQYRVTLSAPSGTEVYQALPASAVCHFRYHAEPARPWHGLGPIEVASLAGRLSAETANALANESSGPQGSILGVPVDGDDETITSLRTDIAAARGRVAFVENSDWGNTGTNGVDLETKRFGAAPPQSLVNLMDLASREVMMACGLNSGLFDSQGSATARESYRLLLFSVIAPLGKMVESELSAKLEDAISLSWVELRAADLVGRARSFQSMVGGGIPLEQAIAVSGLMMPGD